MSPQAFRNGLGVWAWFAKRPDMYRLGSKIAMRVLGMLGRRKGRFRSLPLAGGWTDWRDMPAPEGKTFHQLWAERQQGSGAGATATPASTSDRKAA
jgi:L-lactate dehydrogenase complex protein LldF